MRAILLTKNERGVGHTRLSQSGNSRYNVQLALCERHILAR